MYIGIHVVLVMLNQS